jgi:DNA-binding transcriptional MerR regulator
MSDEFVLETSDELKRKYAPSAQLAQAPVPPTATFDRELQEAFATIPDKLESKIGEVADLAGVKAYVLRYWETEFPPLKPKKSRHNQRVYEKKDVEMVMMIKKLLYRDRYSIEGARSALKDLKKEAKKATAIQGMFHHLEALTLQTQDLLVSIQNMKQRLS